MPDGQNSHEAGDRLIFNSIGRCIYCGTTDGKLSREHIVPFALNGDLELPEASCSACAKITGAIVEQQVLKQTFPHLRYRYQLQTRRPKERPTHFTFGVGNRSATLPISELPYISWAMPCFTMPGIISGRTPSEGGTWHVQAMAGQADFDRLVKRGGGTDPINLPMGKVHPLLFRRMVAKVAHAFAVAILRDTFEPVLTGTILGTSKTHPGYLVGSEAFEEGKAEATLSSITLSMIEYAGTLYIGARMRFFGFLGTPIYVAIVGTPKSGFVMPEKATYVKPVEVSFMAQ